MIDHVKHILFHRHLLTEFLRRDLQARYVGSAMGFFWSVIHPLILLLMYTFVFGVILRVPKLSPGKANVSDFAFYVFCGLLPWYALQESLIRSTTCIVDNAHLIKQVRFPAKILPAYLTLSSIVNQLIGTGIFLLVLLILNHSLPVTVLAFPLVLLIEIVLFFGLGLFFSTLNTYLRDIAPLVTIGIMVLMWATPMFYSMDVLLKASPPPPEWVVWILYGNPFSYMVLIHHHLFIHGTWPPLYYWGVLSGFSVVIFGMGYWLFTRCHSEFADLL